MTYTEFMRRFPDNEACLDYLRDRFFPKGTPCPKCQKPSRFHKINGRSAYSCQHCGHHVYPTAGTIFHKSTTSLQLWFWAIFLMSSTRCGISAKQLEREIGVSNKTALRMFRQIRTLLHEDDEALGGEGSTVEVDETFYGGRPKAYPRVTKNSHWDRKQLVMAAVERKGRVVTRCVPTIRGPVVEQTVREFVLPGSMIYTDEYRGYSELGKRGYKHRRVNHSAKFYVEGDVHTNTIEGFFGLVKNGIRGVYHSVSKKHLQSYLDEYSFRYNRRDSETPMFWLILDRVQKTRPAGA
ncbi:MAG TPA: IS1595 family transposase [Gaiellaceae bacterium]